MRWQALLLLLLLMLLLLGRPSYMALRRPQMAPLWRAFLLWPLPHRQLASLSCLPAVQAGVQPAGGPLPLRRPAGIFRTQVGGSAYAYAQSQMPCT